MKQEIKCFDFGANCFDVIRAVSAILIVVYHVSQHLDISIGLPGWDITGMWIGLFCLFTISGYLIPASLERSKSNKEYLLKRFIRLYPGLWAALIVSLGGLLIIGGWGGLSFRATDILKWLAAWASVFQFYTPATIEAYGVGNPNGSLWTISMEIQIYFVIMFLWKWLKKRSVAQWIGFICVAVAVNAGFGMAYDMMPLMVAKLINVTFIPYAYVFLIGMFCYAQKEKIVPLLSKHFWKLILVYYVWHSVNVLVLHFEVGHFTNIITGFLLSILTMSGSYHFGKIRMKQELSYGVYIYHMIVVNVLAMLGWRGQWVCVPVVVAITYLLAYLSNRFIEKPAMQIVHQKH